MGLQNIITAMTYTGNWAGLFAAVMMVFLPTFILYLLLSDKIVSGITGGGVKGRGDYWETEETGNEMVRISRFWWRLISAALN